MQDPSPAPPPSSPTSTSKILTVSRLRTRGTCARADYLRHDEELCRADVVVPGEPLVRGSVIHAGLAVACAAFPGRADASAIATACVTEAVAQGLGATDPRVAKWGRVAQRAAAAVDAHAWRPVVAPSGAMVGREAVGWDDAADQLADATTGLLGGARDALVEVRMCVPLPDGDPTFGEGSRGWLFSFKPDAVLEHLDSGRRWLWDHKTKSEISRVEPWTDLHLQGLLYVRALRTIGIDVDGAVLYAVLAAEPTVPELRKDGQLKNINYATDWPTACATIERSADPDPMSERYAGLRESIAARRWQLPQEVLFSDDELEVAWEHLLAARDDLVASRARDVKKALDLRLPVWRAVHPSGRGHACGSCDYREWCAEDFAGRDPEMLIGSLYRRGTDKYLAEVALTSSRGDTRYTSPGELNGIDKHRARP